MRLLKQAMAVLGTVVVIAMMAALVAPKPVHGLVATMVQVVNTSTNPVPVTGTVGLSGTPTVNVSNVPLVTEELQNPAASPAFTLLSCSYGSGSNCVSGVFTVPSDVPVGALTVPVKRLVIDFVSGNCSVSGGSVSLLVLEDEFGILFNIWSNYFALSGERGGFQVFDQQTQMYASAGDNLQFLAVPTGGSGSCTITINGHYVTTQ